MMGTLATGLAGEGVQTPEEYYWADVEGDIENVEGTLKITQIRVKYHIEVPKGKREATRDVLGKYLQRCPAAQSVIGCITITDNAEISELD